LPVQCAARAIAVTTVVILLAAGPVSDQWNPANAAAAESGEAGPACAVDVPALRYVVLFEHGTAQDVATAAIFAAAASCAVPWSNSTT